jgi:hypothetical protein
VFTINAAGTQHYYFKLRKRFMSAGSVCVVYNAAFSVVFIPTP